MVVHTYVNGLAIDSERRYYIRLRDVPKKMVMATLLHYKKANDEVVTMFGPDCFYITGNIGVLFINRFIESSAAVYFEFANELGEFYLRHNTGSYLTVSSDGAASFKEKEKTLLRINLLGTTATKPPVVLIKLADNTNRFLTHNRNTNDSLNKLGNFGAVFRAPNLVSDEGNYADEEKSDTQFAIRLDTVFMGP
jgi:hypothetical protein